MKVQRQFDDRWIGEPNSGCWLWLGAVHSRTGHGLICGARHRGAHRVSYEHYIGPIPEGLHLDHLCRTPSCVNPWHLEPVTQAENARRHYRSQTHCKHGHPLSGDNLDYHKQGRRQCRACRTVSQRSRRRECA